MMQNIQPKQTRSFWGQTVSQSPDLSPIEPDQNAGKKSRKQAISEDGCIVSFCLWMTDFSQFFSLRQAYRPLK